MVEAINSWAQKMVMLVIICTIIEMILPEGKNKKYIKTVMGIYIVFTIISPIISKIQNKSINLDNYLNLENNENTTIQTVAPLNTNTYIEKVYLDKIKKDIEEKIILLGYKAVDIQIEIETKNENKYGEILSVNLDLEPNETESTKNIKVNEIVIGKAKTKESNISEEEIINIKKYLSKAYDLDENRIEVK